MDGTLTEPRKPFENKLISSLVALSSKTDIGILTGSDLNYIQQQLQPVLKSSVIRPRLHLLPCNGTKYYPPTLLGSPLKIEHEINMEEKLGTSKFKKLMTSLIEILSSLDFHGFPLTGHFISYRGSMINFCPIGRNASNEDRKKFIEYDNLTIPTYREKIVEKIETQLKLKKINHLLSVKLGGATSFDIYPKGWDKTYALNYFEGWDVWFVGDKCKEGGNDKEIYDLLLEQGRSYETKDPSNTELIIKNDIIPNL
jgi:phosphomannomutase